MDQRAASGSPRTYVDDEWPGAVGQARSTDEVSEQCRRIGGGGDGGKGPGQREPEPAKRAPGTAPGRRAECAGTGTPSSGAGQEGAVHGAAAPRLQHRASAGGVPRAEEGRRGIDGETWEHYGQAL